MLIGVPREVASGERRVALVPEVVSQLTRSGHRVIVERGAGIRAGFTDEAYRAAGCDLADSAEEIYSSAQMILKVQRPGRAEVGEAELDQMKEGSILIGLLQPSGRRSRNAERGMARRPTPWRAAARCAPDR